MKEGAQLLVQHIMLKHNVGILVDVDADGYTSAALLTNYLKRLFPSWASQHLKHYFHADKQHGLSDTVEQVLNSGVELAVVPDAGGGDGIYAKELAEHKIDTLIIDHHETTLEECGPAVVINNQLNNYPNPTLSGVGVVYKFCQYLDSILDKHIAEDYLDLVAVGCVADLMPLTNYETLYYIRKGLAQIKNPFLQAMVTMQDYLIKKHGYLDPYAVGFYIAPVINAVIRVGEMNEKQTLFYAMLDDEGIKMVPSTKRGHKPGEMETLAQQACRVGTSAKTRQTTTRDKLFEELDGEINERGLLDNKIVALKIPKEKQVNKNILGLIANILMSKYQRPILLLNEVTDEETGETSWAGSGRDYTYSAIDNLNKFLDSLPETAYVRGHASAFGVSIPDKEFNSFIEHTNSLLRDIDFTPLYKVDFLFNNGDFDPNIIFKVAELEPIWGQQFDKPWIGIKDIDVTTDNIKLMSRDKSPTLKITLPNGVELIKFKSSEEEYNTLCEPDKVATIEIVGTCKINTYLGTSTPQIQIEEYNLISKTYDF